MDNKLRLVNKIENTDFSDCFIVDDIAQREYSYGEFFSCVFAWVEVLKGNVEREIVAILDNSFSLVVLYFATIFLGKTIAVLDPHKKKAEIEQILLEHTDYVLIDDANIKTYSVKLVNRKRTDIKTEVIEKFKRCRFDVDYLITYTSGTSGNTKGVVHSFGNIVGSAYALGDMLSIDHRVFLHFLPMTYMAGILNSIFLPFLYDNTIVLSKRFDVLEAVHLWEKVMKYKVGFMWMSPMILSMIYRMDTGERGVEYCKKNALEIVVATAPLSAQNRLQFETRYNIKLKTSYGLSETLFLSVETEWSQANGQEPNVGEIINGIEYGFDSDGELLVSVPWIFKGYTNEPTEEYFANKYYRTGDIATVRNNIITISGRKKDLIIRGGMNISPAMIEKKIEELNLVDEVVVYGRQKGNGEEQVCCAYVMQENSVLDECDVERKIIRYILDELGRNYAIDEIRKVDSMPRNINGKVDKKMLG